MKSARALLLILFSGVVLICCAQNVEKLDPKAFEQKVSDTPNATLLDVRTPDEFKSGHLPNAVNIDWKNSSFSDKVSELDKSKPVLVYCYSGARSHEAATKMRTMGFTVTELDGGIRAWTESGRKTVRK